MCGYIGVTRGTGTKANRDREERARQPTAEEHQEPATGGWQPYSRMPDADRRVVQFWRLAKGATAGGVALQPGWHITAQSSGGWHVTCPQGRTFSSVKGALEAMGVGESLHLPLPSVVYEQDLAEARQLAERYGSDYKVTAIT